MHLRFCVCAWLAIWPLQAAVGTEDLLAAQPRRFKPVTLEAERPKFYIPPDSRLARNEHPRLLIVKEDLAPLRSRLTEPHLASEFEALKRQAGANWSVESGAWKQGLLWKLTGDRKYLDLIKNSPEFKKPAWVFGWAAPGLHKRRGTVNVSRYHGDGLLHQRGFLKVSDNRRFLAYSDGTPFLWLGDTAWNVPQRASDEEWETYIADRTNKHFSVIQVAPAPQWAGLTDRQGQIPFTDKSCAQWNPAYWQGFERKVQRANESGLVVMLVGLMEPVSRYPEATHACLFARNIVARLFGNLAIFSPSFDSEFMPLANEVGRAAREATSVHLITQHPGTPWNTPTPTISDKYYDESYLDFVGVQSCRWATSFAGRARSTPEPPSTWLP